MAGRQPARGTAAQPAPQGAQHGPEGDHHDRAGDAQGPELLVGGHAVSPSRSGFGATTAGASRTGATAGKATGASGSSSASGSLPLGFMAAMSYSARR
ncbi:hypothetical protein G6F55_014466 [Rhizopus delemar]|nr:hypothetical protein G6F55_014466 [Rhizopus delemar]